jgi:acetate kinase
MKILVLNSGSSSLKYQLIDTQTEEVVAKGLAECIGVAQRCGQIIQETEFAGKIAFETEMNCHDDAMDRVFALLTDPEKGVVKRVDEIAAIGHRVVHGGEKFVRPTLITDDVLCEVEKVSQLAPLHNPPNLAGIRACMRLMPGIPQVAVFDTAFHATIPDYAYMYALPYDYYTAFGVRRYGFHGTSHQYVAGIALDMLAKEGIAPGSSRIITCHLGNGCSMTAIQGGRAVDTSMGLTPAEGLVMGTRSGDLDPAILVYLARRLDAPASDIDRIINKESGLLGISGLSSDMRDIVDAAAKGNARAELALAVFCYRIRKYVGAYAAAMGGLDAIVFTAGIGENSPIVRERVCRDLGFLGVELDATKNETERGRAINLATPASRVRVLLVPTNEERMIARETARVIAGSAAPSPLVVTP